MAFPYQRSKPKQPRSGDRDSISEAKANPAARRPALLKKLDASALWEYALRLLDRRAYASAELRRKLLPRAEQAEDVAKTIDKLIEYGLLNDARFADIFATALRENEGFGPQRVLRELRFRQVESAVAGVALEHTYGDVDEADLAAQYLNRKFRSKDLPVFLKEQKNLANAFRRLRTAGFSSNVSMKVLKRFAQHVDEADLPPEEIEDDETESFKE